MIEKNFVLFKNYTALIVDDDISLLEDLKIVLNFFFKKVITATDGQIALDLFEKNDIDIIFSDYVMPNIDGYELCKRIRSINKDIPIVLLSSYSDSEKLLKLIDLKLSGYIIKPYEFNDITEVLKNIIVNMDDESLYDVYLDEGLCFNTKTRVLLQNGVDVKLTKNEITLIELFIKNPNQIIPQDTIDNTLNPENPMSYQASKNIIYRLRKKIGKEIFQNVQSLGYIFHKK